MIIEKGSTRTRLALGVLFGPELAESADPALLEWIEQRPHQWRQAVRVLWHASGRPGPEAGLPAAPPHPQRPPEREPALLGRVLVAARPPETTVDWRGRTVLVLGDGADLAVAVGNALRAAGARTECVTLRETARLRVNERAGQVMTAAELAKRLRDEPQPDWLFLLTSPVTPRSTNIGPVDAVHVRAAMGALRDVLAARRDGRTAAVTALDGRFGETGAVPLDPVAGAMTGLLRGHAQSRVLDVAPSVGVDEVARQLLTFAEGTPDHRELGFDGTAWVTPAFTPARLGGETGLPLEPGSTVIAAGGARGRAAEVLVAMAAEVPCRYVLLGRTPLVNIYATLGVGDRDYVLSMGAQEFEEHRIRQRESLKAHSPDFSEEEFDAYWARLSRSLDVMRTIGRMRDAGAQVEYLQQDVTDSHAVRRLGQELRSRGLQIHGLVHAAAHGDESDAEAWDRTIATRINGFYHLVPLLDDQVRLVALLGSSGGSAESAGSGFLVPLADRLAAEFPQARVRSVHSAAASVILAALRSPQAPRTLVERAGR
ncbi:KR domain-containing protein [Lentzea californiensis]|uniref:KR domain-containing protein n=1 Tax=Lentzea californiensis TaxID=438851 RepID=UPI002165B2D0|nr:KR domain-containing protein [Lentzea californiensis]MCR3752083.1 KR domain-containing protein [Lentzea californiensis]